MVDKITEKYEVDVKTNIYFSKATKFVLCSRTDNKKESTVFVFENDLFPAI